MSGDRDKEGRFKKGAPSPNKAGRPTGSSRRIRTTEDIAEAVMRVMNRKVPQKGVGDGLPKVKLLDRNIGMIASPSTSARLAVKDTLQLAKWAASELERRERLREDKERAARSRNGF